MCTTQIIVCLIHIIIDQHLARAARALRQTTMLRLTCIVAIATVAVALVDLAVAEGRSRSFEMLPYSDVTFDENLMFDLAVRSKLDCAKECTGQDSYLTLYLIVIVPHRS